MGFLDGIRNWIKPAIARAIEITKGVGQFLTTAANTAEALFKGEELAREVSGPPRSVGTEQESNWSVAVARRDQHIHRQIGELSQELVIVKQRLASSENTNKLALMLIELRVSGEILRGIGANIDLHSANLRIHLQTIRNVTGLLDDVNRQRTAIKTLVGRVNHILNVLGRHGSDEKIVGLDVERRDGAISIKAAYEAYEDTKGKLTQEVLRFGGVVDAQWKNVDAVDALSKHAPQRRKIARWLDIEVRPALHAANSSAKDVFERIGCLMTIENQLKNELLEIELN